MYAMPVFADGDLLGQTDVEATVLATAQATAAVAVALSVTALLVAVVVVLPLVVAGVSAHLPPALVSIVSAVLAVSVIAGCAIYAALEL